MDWLCISCHIRGAKGPDTLGEIWAQENNVAIVKYPADWKKYGKRAGPIRNQLMAENAEGLIAIWDGKSRGTLNMIETAKELGLRICIYRTDINTLEEIEPTGRLAGVWEYVEERAGMKQYEAGISRLQAEREAGALYPNKSSMN